MANELKKIIQELRPWTRLNLKVVERSGLKLQDILCKSNPWDNSDCGRPNCFTCESSAKGEKLAYKSCFKRSVVYETWCESCLSNNKIVNTDDDQEVVDVNSRSEDGKDENTLRC